MRAKQIKICFVALRVIITVWVFCCLCDHKEVSSHVEWRFVCFSTCYHGPTLQRSWTRGIEGQPDQSADGMHCQEFYSAVCWSAHCLVVASRKHILRDGIPKFTRQQVSFVWESYDGNCRALWCKLYDPRGIPSADPYVTHWMHLESFDDRSIWLEEVLEPHKVALSACRFRLAGCKGVGDIASDTREEEYDLVKPRYQC